MRPLLRGILFLLVAPLLPAFAQNAATSASELAQMRSEFLRAMQRVAIPVLTDYQRRLKTQKDFYVRQGRLAEALAAENELAAVTRQLATATEVAQGKIAAPAAKAPSPVGAWGWIGKQNVIATIQEDRTVLWNGKPSGTWGWIDKSQRQFFILWHNNRKDTLTLLADGSGIKGFHEDGSPIGIRARITPADIEAQQSAARGAGGSADAGHLFGEPH